jgi:hypothetical protein
MLAITRQSTTTSLSTNRHLTIPRIQTPHHIPSSGARLSLSRDPKFTDRSDRSGNRQGSQWDCPFPRRVIAVGLPYPKGALGALGLPYPKGVLGALGLPNPGGVHRGGLEGSGTTLSQGGPQGGLGLPYPEPLRAAGADHSRSLCFALRLPNPNESGTAHPHSTSHDGIGHSQYHNTNYDTTQSQTEQSRDNSIPQSPNRL